MTKFEKLGREIIRHKYLYYIKATNEISDYEYDEMERLYVQLAKNIKKEPKNHIIADWNEKWAGTLIDFPHTHPWAKELLKKENDHSFNDV